MRLPDGAGNLEAAAVASTEVVGVGVEAVGALAAVDSPQYGQLVGWPELCRDGEEGVLAEPLRSCATAASRSSIRFSSRTRGTATDRKISVRPSSVIYVLCSVRALQFRQSGTSFF